MPGKKYHGLVPPHGAAGHATETTVEDDNYTGVGDIEKAYDALFLPEPTALALLALGVAGLALRRKAA